MTTQKTLYSLLNEVGQLSHLPTSHEQAIMEGKDKYLFLDYASSYGGWRLVNVDVKRGAHCGAFGGNGCEARLKGAVMEVKLRALIEGLKFSQKELLNS